MGAVLPTESRHATKSAGCGVSGLSRNRRQTRHKHCARRMAEYYGGQLYSPPMKTNDIFYHLHSATDTPCHLSHEARKEALRTWLCPACSSLKPGVTMVDARLVAVPDKSPLNF